VENGGNTLILVWCGRKGGASRFASRLIGEREIVRMHQSRSRNARDWRSSVTSSEHYVTEAAVLPSEIEQLPDLQSYLKLASFARLPTGHCDLDQSGSDCPSAKDPTPLNGRSGRRRFQSVTLSSHPDRSRPNIVQ
jgi:hypothetical protein